MILILYRKTRKKKFQLRPTDKETNEEKNETVRRDAHTHRVVEREQQNVSVMRH